MKIQVGDIVQADINAAQVTLGTKLEVLYVPLSDGDYWTFLKRVWISPDQPSLQIIKTNERLTVIKNIE